MAALSDSVGTPGTPPRRRRIARGELARKTVHIAVGLIAYALRWLGPWWGAAAAAAAVVGNVFVLPRLGGRQLYREADHARGHAIGMILYPLSVLLLIVAFHERLEVAAAAWGILAFGDGMASIVGITLGRRALPWNPGKTWAGTAAYALFGGLGAWTLLLWTAPGRYEPGFALAVAAVAAGVAALLESMPHGLDDNLGVPMVVALLLLGLVLTQGGWGVVGEGAFLRALAVGAAVNLVLAALGYLGRTVNVSGAVAGWVVGTVIWAFLGWQGYLLLIAFFVLGSGATKLGYRRKAAAKLAQEEGGRRGARHALANVGVALACAVFAATTPYPLVFALAFAAAFATAASDTAGSEIGQLWGRRTFLLTTLRPVPRGTDGAVSLEGTLAGIAASFLLGALGAAVGLYPWEGVWVVVVAAFVGTTLESLLGATVERRGLLDNEAMNFLNTLVGALVAAALAGWVV
ncbi:MAG TPA: TIGR00297 family protein [Thermoanaerobaculia bacterium]|nr:TIGR00297 family protein [Thermoanaerobaculia bacterium]